MVPSRQLVAEIAATVILSYCHKPARGSQRNFSGALLDTAKTAEPLTQPEHPGKGSAVEETLKRIKELALVEDRVAFSKKSRDEMAADHLTRDEVVSSIYNAKSVRSKRSLHEGGTK